VFKNKLGALRCVIEGFKNKLEALRRETRMFKNIFGVAAIPT